MNQVDIALTETDLTDIDLADIAAGVSWDGFKESFWHGIEHPWDDICDDWAQIKSLFN